MIFRIPRWERPRLATTEVDVVDLTHVSTLSIFHFNLCTSLPLLRKCFNDGSLINILAKGFMFYLSSLILLLVNG